VQGDARYVGATPSYVIWNVVQRYTAPGELIVDPMVGSGTTLDVARDTGRRGRGFDLSPYRADIERADARKLPLRDGEADLVFLDPPYGDHIDYSDDPACIGKLSPFEERYHREMGRVFKEARRALKPGGVFALYVCDFYNKQQGFAPVGFALFDLLAQSFEPIDTVAVVRHNRTLEQGNFHKAAEEQNFFLRGFNYLFLVRKPVRR
jgi:DNA modification methylase